MKFNEKELEIPRTKMRKRSRSRLNGTRSRAQVLDPGAKYAATQNTRNTIIWLFANLWTLIMGFTQGQGQPRARQ
jgi:hypothetical protein